MSDNIDFEECLISSLNEMNSALENPAILSELQKKAKSRDWRPCKRIHPKYLKHVACPQMDVFYGHIKESCDGCICTKFQLATMDIQNVILATIAVTISVVSVVITVLKFVFK
jgi:hypothetical protein